MINEIFDLACIVQYYQVTFTTGQNSVNAQLVHARLRLMILDAANSLCTYLCSCVHVLLPPINNSMKMSTNQEV